MIKLSATTEATAELYIYGAIGDPWDGITPKAVADALKDAGDAKWLDVRINSEGGIAFDGVAILNLLRSAKQQVNVLVDGIAASAASIIAMAGETITMGSGAMLMVHDPWGFVMGAAEEMRHTATILESVRDQVAEIYAARSTVELEEIRALMTAETWMTAEEAMAIGLADEVVEREMAAAKWDLTKFSNPPEDLLPYSVRKHVSAGRSPMSTMANSDTIRRVADAVEHATPHLDHRSTKIRLRRKLKIV